LARARSFGEIFHSLVGFAAIPIYKIRRFLVSETRLARASFSTGSWASLPAHSTKFVDFEGFETSNNHLEIEPKPAANLLIESSAFLMARSSSFAGSNEPWMKEIGWRFA